MPNNLPIARDNRYYSLDLWRGIACLMVIGFHAAYYVTENGEYPPGLMGKLFHLVHMLSLGVPFFFVISGYCISAACDNQRARKLSAGNYFFRRFRRIFPPYWIALALTLIGTIVLARLGWGWLLRDDVHPVPKPGWLSIWQWLGNLTLTETWRWTIFHPGREWWDSLFLGHAWTLCYEEQFYAVCGAALLLSRRWFFQALGALTALVAIVTWIDQRHFTDPLHPSPIAGFFFDGHWLLFAAGVAVYYYLHYASRRTRWAIVLTLGLTCLATGKSHMLRNDYLLQELCSGMLFALLIIALHRWDRSLNDSRLLLPFTACGTMCYSLYLIHWPLVKVISHALYASNIRGPWPTLLITMPICYIASIAAGWLFFVLVERRFLNTRVRKMQQENATVEQSMATSLAS